MIPLITTAALAATMSGWQLVGTDSDEIARHYREIDLVFDGDGRTHLVWTATRMEQGRDYLGNPRWWRSRRVHAVHEPGEGWGEPHDLGHGLRTPVLAPYGDGGVVLFTWGPNQDPHPDAHGTPPGHYQIDARVWRGEWSDPSPVLRDPPAILHGMAAIGTRRGVRVAWAPWRGSHQGVYEAHWSPTGLGDVTHHGPDHRGATITYPDWTRHDGHTRVVALAQGGNKHMPWVVTSGSRLHDTGTASQRWWVHGNPRPGHFSAAWSHHYEHAELHFAAADGLQGMRLHGVREQDVRLDLAGDLVVVGHRSRVTLYRPDGEGGWHKHPMDALPGEVRGLALDVQDGQVALAVASHSEAGDTVHAWTARTEDIPWLSAEHVRMPAPHPARTDGR